VLLNVPQLWPAVQYQHAGCLYVSYRKMKDKHCSTSVMMSRYCEWVMDIHLAAFDYFLRLLAVVVYDSSHVTQL
jgi:hypothetical protein